MWYCPDSFDVIVVGAGHAGCEAAHAVARGGLRALLLTSNLDTIAKMSCNPAVGGIGKGHMVGEIDALGGLMGKVTEATSLQRRMLNRAKGPAVWAPRAQADKLFYAAYMRSKLERTEGLTIIQATVEEILSDGDRIVGLVTKEGMAIRCRAVIVTAGTFMRGLMHIGEQQLPGGRAGDPPSVGLSSSLAKLGLCLGRLKTGTPPRVHRRSIDFTITEEQPGEEDVRFSSDPPEPLLVPQRSCYITYTTEETKKIIQENLHRSLMYSGRAAGSIGPRYCPSIEDKVVRFADKERHQIFLEPEGHLTEEFYINGLSTSLPWEVQYAYMRSIPALRHCEILRPGYAIEYDYVCCGHLDATLKVQHLQGLYLAGQINGTTGYEEAAAQGLMAGINALHWLKERDPLIIRRSEGYIGVMIDDLVTKGVDEPYRMFTSRAEYRLLLRQDNAVYRLRKYGYAAGLIDQERYNRLVGEETLINSEIARLGKTYRQVNGKGVTLLQLLARPDKSYDDWLDESDDFRDHGPAVNQQIELYARYAGYIQRQEAEVERLAQTEESIIPKGIDFSQIVGLRYEAAEKLSRHYPSTLGQASRIPGVSPADIAVLRVQLKRGC